MKAVRGASSLLRWGKFVEKVSFESGVKIVGVMDADVQWWRCEEWPMHEEVNSDTTGEADEVSLQVDSKDEVMHT